MKWYLLLASVSVLTSVLTACAPVNVTKVAPAGGKGSDPTNPVAEECAPGIDCKTPSTDLTDNKICTGDSSGMQLVGSWYHKRHYDAAAGDHNIQVSPKTEITSYLFNEGKNSLNVVTTCEAEGASLTARANAAIIQAGSSIHIIKTDLSQATPTPVFLPSKKILSCRADMKNALLNYHFVGPCLVLTKKGSKKSVTMTPVEPTISADEPAENGFLDEEELTED